MRFKDKLGVLPRDKQFLGGVMLWRRSCRISVGDSYERSLLFENILTGTSFEKVL